MAEHKLITGGEHLLPFARSRVKALRRTGLERVTQRYDIDGFTVRVSIAGEHEFIGIEGGRPDLWVLVNVFLDDTVVDGAGTPGDPDLDTINTTTVKSFLYRIPKNLHATEASLYYSGESESTYAQGITSIGSAPFWYYDNISGSVSDISGAYGALNAFIPYGKEALLVTRRSTQALSATSEGDSTTTTTRTCKVAMGGVEQDYTATYTLTIAAFATTVSTRSGELVETAVRSLQNGQANYTVAQLSGAYASGVGDSPRYDLFAMTPSYGASTDPDGTPALTLTAGSTRYTRREVGHMEQSRRFIFTKAATYERRDRTYNTQKAVSGTANPIFFSNDLVLGLTDPGTPTTLSFTVRDYNGADVATIDLADLPGLAADSFYSSVVSGFAATASPSASVAATSPEVGFGDLLVGADITHPQSFYWTGQDYVGGFPGQYAVQTNYTITATCIPDQKALWSI